MNKFRWAAAVALLGFAGIANAQFSSTITATTDYDFRGITQTALDPALQISADYAFGESGFAVGAWASNVDFGEGAATDYEVDLYGRRTGRMESGYAGIRELGNGHLPRIHPADRRRCGRSGRIHYIDQNDSDDCQFVQRQHRIIEEPPGRYCH